MGWTNTTIVANLVIVEGPNDGLFVYNGTPAAGNLTASIAPAAGTDLFGNSYAAGFATYGLGSAALLSFFTRNAFETAAGTLKSEVLGSGGTSQDVLIIQSGSVGGAAQPFLELNSSSHDNTQAADALLSDGVTGGLSVTTLGGTGAVIPTGGYFFGQLDPANGNKIEAWHPMTLKNSWTNRGTGFVTAQYRMLPLGAGSSLGIVEIIGDCHAGTLTSGTVLATLPTSYAPLNAQQTDVQLALGTPAAPTLTPVLEAETTGDLKLFNIPSGTTGISFHGFISLDA